MRWDKKSLNKIATYFENKIRKEGWESYNKFLREKEILEFSDIIECINNKEDGSIVVKRNAIYSYDHYYTSPTPLPNTSPSTISISSGFSNNKINNYSNSNNKINNYSNTSNVSNTSNNSNNSNISNISSSNSNLSTLNNNYYYSSNSSNITLNTSTIPIYNLGPSNTGALPIYTFSTNDVNLYQDENLYLLVPKKLAEKIFLLESI